MASGGPRDSLRENASCEPCMKSNLSKPATVFCDDCNEYLCDSCEKPHKVYKPGKHNIEAFLDNVDMKETSELVGTLAVDGGWNESEVVKITSNLQDGRLVELSKSFLTQIKHCLDPTNKGGGFGKIYISRVPIPGFKHKLVLKEIGGNDENSKSQTLLLGSVKNEKLASRVRHFAIVPLLAYHDDLSNGKYYLISPYFENGDVFDAQKDDKVLLDWKTRLKVIYQISCAIDYLHTKNSFRGTILHLDIKSKNIVLDKKFNARLIDFGLSRESMTGSDITTAPLAGTELYRPSGFHKPSPLLDYYAFGVVIREMLTGLGPEGTCSSQTPLGLLDMVNFAGLIKRHIWKTDVWKDVSEIAGQCLSSVDDDETSGQISSASIRTLLKSILIKQSIQKWTVLDDNNCELCIVNGQLEKENPSFRRVSEINHSDCVTKIKICCACMRNSYINPVKCQECDNEIKSIIGDGWGAILIAGFDEDNNSFQNDVNMFAHAISSKVLPSMCVSTVITIDSATQATEPVSAQIDDAFKKIIENNLHTLVFLYSGHHGKHGLQVGTNEYVSMQHINSNIQKCTHITKVIAFMDCCQPERIRVNEEKQCLIQFNATASSDKAISLINEGSPFTKLLVQAFTMKASGGKCALRDCECRIDGPFITIDSLSHYIEIHRQNGFLLDMEPEKSLIRINWQNECLAYNYSDKVAFLFDIVLPVPSTSKHTYEVLSTSVKNYDALIQTILFPRFAELIAEQLNVQQKSIPHANKNADCLCIVYDTGPKCCEEVYNIEKLLLAWNSKRLLCCKLRVSQPSNFHKPSGFFLKNGNPVKDCMHEKREFELTEMESFMKGLQDTEKNCDTDTKKALTVFISNMSSFISVTKLLYGIISSMNHVHSYDPRKHQRIQIRFIDLFEECTSCVVHLLLVDPDDISESSGDLRNDLTVSIDNTLNSTDASPSVMNSLKSTDFSPIPLLVQVETSRVSLSSQPRPITLELLVSVDLQKTADDEEVPHLVGLDFLPDGRLVAVDNFNTKCIILNEKLQRLGTPYTFKTKPLSVVCVSHDSLCVTSGVRVYLLFVSKDNVIRLTRKINTSSNFYSICCKSPSSMVVSTYEDPRHARLISVDGVESDFDHVVFPKNTYKFKESMCTYVQSKNTLVLIDRYANTVFMYDTVKGTSRAVINKNIQEPRGVCVGPGDTVLVCIENKNSIVQLTIEGKVLGTYPVDMWYPCKICVSKDGTRLAVSNAAKGANKLQLYKI